MSRLRVVVMPGSGAAVELRHVPEPVLEAGSALLRVELSEVCGTDVALRDGRLAGVPYPIIPGHVSAGRLEKIRGTITDMDGTPFREGDLVTFLDVHRTCNACWYCLVAKATTRCPRRKVYGITYGLADGLTGGWADAVVLKPGTLCLGLGDAASERFMTGGCSLPTALHAVERAEVAIGDTVLVLAWVRERTAGRGADITIEATGAPEAVAQAMRFTRDAGRVVVAGQYADHGDASFNPHADLNRKHLEVRGCWGSDFSHFARAVRIAADPERSRPWSRIPTARYGLERANQALDDVAARSVVKALIVPGVDSPE